MALCNLPSSTQGRPTRTAGPPSAVSRASSSQAVAAGLLEGGLQHQVLGRIAGEIELRRHHEVGAEAARLRPRLSQPVAVAGDVADDEGNLRERDDETVGGGGHGRDLAGAARRSNRTASRFGIQV